jgi:hypothetical protein
VQGYTDGGREAPPCLAKTPPNVPAFPCAHAACSLLSEPERPGNVRSQCTAVQADAPGPVRDRGGPRARRRGGQALPLPLPTRATHAGLTKDQAGQQLAPPDRVSQRVWSQRLQASNHGSGRKASARAPFRRRLGSAGLGRILWLTHEHYSRMKPLSFLDAGPRCAGPSRKKAKMTYLGHCNREQAIG